MATLIKTKKTKKIKSVETQPSNIKTTSSKHKIYLNIILLRTFLTWLNDVSSIREDKETFSTIVDFIISKKLLSISQITELLRYNPATINRWRNRENYPNSFVRDNIVLALEKELVSELRKNEALEEELNKPNIKLTV